MSSRTTSLTLIAYLHNCYNIQHTIDRSMAECIQQQDFISNSEDVSKFRSKKRCSYKHAENR